MGVCSSFAGAKNKSVRVLIQPVFYHLKLDVYNRTKINRVVSRVIPDATQRRLAVKPSVTAQKHEID